MVFVVAVCVYMEGAAAATAEAKLQQSEFNRLVFSTNLHLNREKWKLVDVEKKHGVVQLEAVLQSKSACENVYN